MTNGGYFVLSPCVVDLIEGNPTMLEREPLERLAKNGQLAAFELAGFCKPMDMLRHKTYLEGLTEGGQAPWKVWA